MMLPQCGAIEHTNRSARAQIKTEVYQQYTQKISRKVFGLSCVMCQSVIAVSVLRGSLGGSFVCLLLFVCC